MALPSSPQKLLNTAQRCFESHLPHEVVKTVFYAENGVHDFQLITDVLWELIPEVLGNGMLLSQYSKQQCYRCCPLKGPLRRAEGHKPVLFGQIRRQ